MGAILREGYIKLGFVVGCGFGFRFQFNGCFRLILMGVWILSLMG